MKKVAKVSELKASLSKYLARVKAGEEVVVTERGKAIAKLVPMPRDEDAEMERLREMERRGVLTFPEREFTDDFWDLPWPEDPGDTVLKALLEEREHWSVRFWDSSAIVPLCLYETQSELVRALFSQDKQMAAWWATSVECEALMARRRRAGTLSDSANSAAQERLRRWRWAGSRWIPGSLSETEPGGWFGCIRFGQPTRCNSLRR